MFLVTMLELVLYLSVLVTVIYSLIFGYHWYRFGTKNSIATSSLIIFITGASCFLLVMLIAFIYAS